MTKREIALCTALTFVWLFSSGLYAEEKEGVISSLELEHVYTGEVFSNLSGGAFDKQGEEYRGNFDFTVTLDSECAGLWNGTTLFVYFQDGHGKGITEEYVGDLQVLSNFDAHEFAQVSEYYLIQSFWGGRLMVKLGKQDANVDFNVAECAGEFINSSFGIMPNVPLPTFPHPTLGVAVFAEFTERVGVSAGLFDCNGCGGRWGFDTAFDSDAVSVSVLEGRFCYAHGSRGALKLGVWRHGGEHPSLYRGSAKSSNVGAYLILEQGLYGDPEKPGLCIDSFIQYGYAEKDINEIPNYYGAGVSAAGFLARRPRDSMGIGFAMASFNPDLEGMEDETAVEAYYCAPIREWLSIQPDIQYILNPGGAGDDAFVAGMRFLVMF